MQTTKILEYILFSQNLKFSQDTDQNCSIKAIELSIFTKRIDVINT